MARSSAAAEKRAAASKKTAAAAAKTAAVSARTNNAAKSSSKRQAAASPGESFDAQLEAAQKAVRDIQAAKEASIKAAAAKKGSDGDPLSAQPLASRAGLAPTRDNQKAVFNQANNDDVDMATAFKIPISSLSSPLPLSSARPLLPMPLVLTPPARTTSLPE